jgi:hypothetical protein
MTYYETIALLIAILGWPISSYFAYRWGLRSQERADIRRGRADLIPLLKNAILECGNDTQPQIAWRQKHSLKIGEVAPRFSTFLKGKRQAVFDAAWYKCCQTQDAELMNKNQGCFLPGQEAELKAAQELIVCRLQAVLDHVKRA